MPTAEFQQKSWTLSKHVNPNIMTERKVVFDVTKITKVSLQLQYNDKNLMWVTAHQVPIRNRIKSESKKSWTKILELVLHIRLQVIALLWTRQFSTLMWDCSLPLMKRFYGKLNT